MPKAIRWRAGIHTLNNRADAPELRRVALTPGVSWPR